MSPSEQKDNTRGFLIKTKDSIVKGVRYVIGVFQIPQSPKMDPAERKLKIYEVVVKGIIGALVGGLIYIVGVRMETNRQRLADQEEASRLLIAENNKNMATLSELSAKQKEKDVDLGMQMFQTLMAHYLKASGPEADSAKRQQQMMLLRLITLNFQDSPINIKPLFEDLDRQLTDTQEKLDVRELAMEVARHQTFRLISQNGDVIDRDVEKGTEFPLQIQIPVTIKIEEVGKDKVKASLTSEFIPGKPKIQGPFSINYFDTPLNDNTKFGPWRVSLLLLNIEGEKAKVRVVTFESYLAPDRFDIKELTQDLRAVGLSLPEKNKQKP
jgi:hypothetical protein